ncbi:hypothetical protein Q6272_28130, partial [Klebsiella pneumoniae]|nr:hypothetical protein [Klebsiella pneumoniae]
PAGSRFLLLERQSLLTHGVATAYYGGGAVRIERAITTYQRNAFDQSDDSYLDSETLHTSAYVINFLKTRVTLQEKCLIENRAGDASPVHLLLKSLECPCRTVLNSSSLAPRASKAC